MALVKTPQEIDILREGGSLLARVRDEVASFVRPGVSTAELDSLAEKRIRTCGGEPAFLGYRPAGAPRPYPATLCVSVNDEVVHGIPTEHPRILVEGDIVGLDIGMTYKGLITDTAVTVPVGNVSKEIAALLNTTKEALAVGIKAARADAHIGDIGHAIETFVAGRYGIVRDLGGHGVGHQVHEEPYIANVGAPGTGIEIVPNMVLALEPMLNLKGADVVLEPDGYTVKTADGSPSAHFEHTIVIGTAGPEIITISE